MSGPFTLAVDPDGMAAAAARLARMATALDEQAGGLRDAEPGLARAFRSDAAAAFGTEIQHLAAGLAGAGPKVGEAIRALRELADRYRQAVHADLPRLNREWEEAADTATRSRLQAEFDRLRARLRAETGRAGGALSAAVQVAVPAGAATSVPPGEVPSWAWTALAGSLPLTALGHALHVPPEPTDAAALRRLLDTARTVGLAPAEYAPLLQNYYLALALEHAGIDWPRWDPSLGPVANQAAIFKVWEYYGRLYLANPYFRWAGMANLIGPSFGGGFFDLHLLRDLAKDIGSAGKYLGHPEGTLLGVLATMTDAELKYFESTLVGMQKKIFVDQASMHEAYLAGGLPAIEELGAAGILPPSAVDAWAAIDHGWRDCDPAAVSRGNADLLHREQYDIIGADYDAMRHFHGPIGEAFTFAVTAVGSPSIPAAHAFGEVFPVQVTVDAPVVPAVTVSTNWPAGNVSQRDERWALISQDTLPAYEHLLETDPERLRSLVASSIPDRVAEQRLAAQWPHILARLAEIRVNVHQ